MDYTKIENPDDVASQSLLNEASGKEQSAYILECAEEEARALTLRDLPCPTTPEQAQENARVARREANVYAKAAGLTEAQKAEIRQNYLHRWVEHIERQHIHHSAVLKVRAELGEPTADYDSILAGLDVSHDVAVKRLAELEGRKLNKSTRRSTPRQSK